MSKPKILTKYDESDLAQIITDFFLNIESPDGERFKALHSFPNVVAVRINNKTFLVSVTEKDKLN